MHGWMGRLWAPFLLAVAGPAAAEEFAIGLPVDCAMGESCYIQQYFDRDASEGAVVDFACGDLANDGHGGVDFAVPTLAEMRQGVPVIAVAPGRVIATRDGMPDISSLSPEAPDLAGRDCGNGVVVDHGEGWATQYCHLREGSVLVTKGTEVARGEALGLIGMSGRASFPHVHFTLRKGRNKVDPYDVAGAEGCPLPASLQGVWEDPPAYVPGGILEIGMADRVPSLAEVREGLTTKRRSPPKTPALVVWFYAFAGKKGDEVEIIFEGPEGEIARHSEVLEKSQPFFLRGFGKRVPVQGWPWGVYRGTAVMRRDGVELGREVVETTVD